MVSRRLLTSIRVMEVRGFRYAFSLARETPDSPNCTLARTMTSRTTTVRMASAISMR
jgi:hypothetical protein